MHDADVTIDSSEQEAVFYDGTRLDLSAVYEDDAVTLVVECATVRGVVFMGLRLTAQAMVTRHTFTAMHNEDGDRHVVHNRHDFRGPVRALVLAYRRAMEDLPGLWVDYITHYALREAA